ncbi:Arginine/ornithine antiporter ArcD [Desulfovibrio sp. DV]|uniref:SxtJ family membrane protein n=1 Tax=Desulfovibrio sp. DV TaxID=1844708 RepID=UPI00094B8577|nr:SxtJ family membrane protein [Desulfovibrio sp. DV]OLN30847.1 Arginine/ornithine antiporter ArcD [Desulfovibrio sp. DV]
MSSLEHKRQKASFWLSATRDQARDTGMALVLVSLIVFFVTREIRYVTIAAGLLLLDMISPSLFKPAAKVWFGLSHVLGTVMSKVLLTLVFFLVLTPMGLMRGLLGKDPMRIGQFKKDTSSAFRVRDHAFTPADIEQPF